ncbi:hypothetical protein VTL71DRAFT_4052 [Oculimacula yallundae]|uniref:Uncharacterized protein n=1 Tax=Oculimacula yallundae TaxID=86028 RepID=A0ABR4C4P3_9HELO
MVRVRKGMNAAEKAKLQIRVRLARSCMFGAGMIIIGPSSLVLRRRPVMDVILESVTYCHDSHWAWVAGASASASAGGSRSGRPGEGRGGEVRYSNPTNQEHQGKGKGRGREAGPDQTRPEEAKLQLQDQERGRPREDPKPKHCLFTTKQTTIPPQSILTPSPIKPTTSLD